MGGPAGGAGGSVGGGFRRRPRTGGGDTTEVGEYFTPGQDGNLAWNTTQPIVARPILLYIFDGHVFEGSNYDYSKTIELGMFKNKELIKESRDFVCEKICIDDHEFLRKVKGREPVNGFLAANMEKKEQRVVQLAFLDSSGRLISVFDDPKALKDGVPALRKAMRQAREENARRLEAAAPKKS
jgi:hypothetical protein